MIIEKEDKMQETICVSDNSDNPVFFYEKEFYIFSNFSSFKLYWDKKDFDTSEAAYQYEKYKISCYPIAETILKARSAHEAYKIAQVNKDFQDPDWDDIKLGIMFNIISAKVAQHKKKYKKLLETGNREIIEDSWRDDYWGWGPNKDGKNMLGKLWMKLRYKLQ